jgi:hypothetical protein
MCNNEIESSVGNFTRGRLVSTRLKPCISGLMTVHLSVVNFTHIVLYHLIPAVSSSWCYSVCSVVLRVATVNVLRCVNFCSFKL